MITEIVARIALFIVGLIELLDSWLWQVGERAADIADKRGR